jgi:peptide/nickel transport system permease protein
MSTESASVPRTGSVAIGDARAHRSPLRRAAERFAANRLAVIGAIMLIVMTLIALAAPWLTSADPAYADFSAVAQAPGRDHPLGTDTIGRDIWARLVYGARTSLAVGFGAVTIAIVIGTAAGLLSGFYRGVVDGALMRLTDTVMSVPPLLMVIVFVSVVGPSLGSVVTIIALMMWTGTARLVRAQVLSLREQDFVTALRVIGLRDRGLILRHLLPNTLGPVTVVATFGFASAILLEAGLSFLGLGVKPPATSWGVMVNLAQTSTVLIDRPWMWVPPAIAIALVVLAVNLVGDGLRDAFDPRGSRRG